MLFKRKTVLLAKKEAYTAGTQPYGDRSIPLNTIDTSATALNIIDPEITPLAGELKPFNVVRPWFGAESQIQTTKYCEFSCKVPLTGAQPITDGFPLIDPLLASCNLNLTFNKTAEINLMTKTQTSLGGNVIELTNMSNTHIGDIVTCTAVPTAIPANTVITELTNTVSLKNITLSNNLIANIPASTLIQIGASYLTVKNTKDITDNTEVLINDIRGISSASSASKSSSLSPNEFNVNSLNGNIFTYTVNADAASLATIIALRKAGVAANALAGYILYSPNFPTCIRVYKNTASSGGVCTVTLSDPLPYQIKAETEIKFFSPSNLAKINLGALSTTSLTVLSCDSIETVVGKGSISQYSDLKGMVVSHPTVAKTTAGISLLTSGTGYISDAAAATTDPVGTGSITLAGGLLKTAQVAALDIMYCQKLSLNSDEAISASVGDNLYFYNNDAVYTAQTEDQPYSSFMFYIDHILHKISGARGNVKFVLNAGEIPYFDFAFKGLYEQPTDTGAVAPTFANWPNPLPVTKEYTTVSYAGNNIAISKLELDLGNQVEYRSFTNVDNVLIMDRKITGTISWEADLSSVNWFDFIENNQTGWLVVTHGKDGNRVTLKLMHASLSNIKYEDNNGVYLFNATINNSVLQTSHNPVITLGN